MGHFVKPVVFISKCIEFESCRWNGMVISSPFVKSLLPHVEAIALCPEVEIGLGVPRKSIRMVQGIRFMLLNLPMNQQGWQELDTH